MSSLNTTSISSLLPKIDILTRDGKLSPDENIDIPTYVPEGCRDRNRIFTLPTNALLDKKVISGTESGGIYDIESFKMQIRRDIRTKVVDMLFDTYKVLEDEEVDKYGIGVNYIDPETMKITATNEKLTTSVLAAARILSCNCDYHGALRSLYGANSTVIQALVFTNKFTAYQLSEEIYGRDNPNRDFFSIIGLDDERLSDKVFISFKPILSKTASEITAERMNPYDITIRFGSGGATPIVSPLAFGNIFSMIPVFNVNLEEKQIKYVTPRFTVVNHLPVLGLIEIE